MGSGSRSPEVLGAMLELWRYSVLILVSATNAKVDFTGQQVLRTSPETVEQTDLLIGLINKFDIWNDGAGREIDIRVSPDSLQDLLDVLESNNIKHSTIIQDLQKIIDLSEMSAVRTRLSANHSMDWTSYHPIEDMYSYLDYLESTFDFVTTESIGQSYEGTEMRLAKVCRGGCGNKPAMWIDGGIHAREWISPAAVTFILRELVENNTAHPDLLENLDWYILPVVNPDGYLFSHTENRMWRKTRSPNPNSKCYGTDPNRNFGYKWGTKGSSTNPCDDEYMGAFPFSEVETANIRDWITAHKDSIKYYLTVHSSGQMILLPWGWGYDQPDNIDDLYRVAEAGNDALYAVHQKSYTVGCIPCLLYLVGGGSLDWTLGELGIPYSYAMELRDNGTYGFLLPADQIIPTGEELWAFNRAVGREIIKEFVSY